MVAVNIRELTHNFAKYMKMVKSGQRVVVMERNKPVADLTPHADQAIKPGWKRPIKRIKLKKGVSLVDELIKDRRDARW